MSDGGFEGAVDIVVVAVTGRPAFWGYRWKVSVGAYTEAGPFAVDATQTIEAGGGDIVDANTRWMDAAGNPLSGYSTQQSFLAPS